MAKKMLIDATHPEETRVVVADGNRVEEFDFETKSKLRLAGNIYLAKVTRVEPSLQAAFVDYGGNRHGFLAFSEIHPDYYQIPVSDRQAILEEEEAFDRMQAAESELESGGGRRSRRRRSRSKAENARPKDSVAVATEAADNIPGMGVVDLDVESDWAEPVDAEAALDQKDDTQGPADSAVTDGASAAADPAENDGPEGGADSDRSYTDRNRGDRMDMDDRIESLAGDEAEEIRQPRKPRPRPYKIQEVIKVRQILLVQVIKEERGNKGAALTTYISLAGRYCVLMPNTARGGGISRKITSASDRSKLKEIASKLDVPKGAGLIIRTAGAKRTKAETRRDYEFLQRLWEQIRELTLNSIAPVQIYEEGNLIKRSIRDLYGREIEEVLVEGDAGYRTAKDFMKMIMPSHAKKVKSYQDPLPLFSRYQVENHLSSMYSPTVQLKSGGYIVIGVTEALVAIDVNSGRATKKGSIEETALTTNLEAAEEIARQLRLRDLAGLIVIDFIDMDERRNNSAVEKRFKDRLRSDRARIQVGRISGFGLLEMSRQRQRLGMIEVTTQECPHCHGTGRIRSDENLALSVLRQLEEEGTRGRQQEMLLTAPVDVVNFLINQKRGHVADIENRYGISIQIEADPALVSPNYTVERLKSANTPQRRTGQVVSVNSSMMPDLEIEDVGEEASDGAVRPEQKQSKPRRSRNRRGSGTDASSTEVSAVGRDAQESVTPDPPEGPGEAANGDSPPEGRAGKKRSGSRRRSRSRKSKSAEDTPAAAEPVSDSSEDSSEATGQIPERKAKRSRRKRSGRVAKTTAVQAEDAVAETDPGAAAPESSAEPSAESPDPSASANPPGLAGRTEAGSEAKEGAEAKESETNIGSEPALSSDDAKPDKDPDAVGSRDESASQRESESGDPEDGSQKPKRRGWWKGRG